MNKFIVIFNPAARAQHSQRLRKFLEAKAGSTAMTLAPTQQVGEAQQLAAQAAREGYELIVAAGGDGTINEVVNGIGVSKARLGLLPGGTVNVFAKELDVPTRLDRAWERLERGTVRTIDLARAEWHGGQRYFVQLAGVGLDALGVQQSSWELKKWIGPMSYVWAGLKAVSMVRPEVEVSADGQGQRGRGVMVAVGNGRFYGGRLPMFPKARLDDGLLDVCVFQNGGYLNTLRYAQGVMRGVHTGFRDVMYFQANQFVCTAPGGVPFELDGELVGEVPVRFSVLPRALRVVV